MDRKVSTANLKTGMYVSRLDRPWKQTPFLVQGFYIENQTDIARLVHHCDYIYIDPEKGEKADMYLDSAPISRIDVKKRLAVNQGAENIINSGSKSIVYKTEKSSDEELPAAKSAMAKASRCIAEVVEHSIRRGKVDVKFVREAVNPVIDSVIRNSDSYLWLSRLKDHEHYSYDQSVKNCGLGIAFGRHIGLNRKDLSTLGTGLLLMDIGKVKLPKEILTSEKPLNKAQTELMQKHVAYSVEMLREAKDVNDHVINIALTHHERYDGSGYPNGLVGTQAPAFGRMAAIVDCYITMTTSTPYRKGIAEHKALQNIYNLRDKLFQSELVEQFIQCMGVYPTGSLVELSSGAVGAVLSQNQQQKMKPRVLILLDENKKPVGERKVVDLCKQGDIPLHVAKSLEPDAYQINMSAIRY